MKPSNKVKVYLEVGQKRTFAGALDWPGWCRVGRDEDAALQALLDYGPRYARVLQAAKIEFHSPTAVSEFAVVEQVEGTSTTDFGAPDVAPSSDTKPVDETELERLRTLLQACWQALDETVQAATGKALRQGPRGGGRDLDGVMQHVLGAEAGYLSRLAWKFKQNDTADLNEELTRTRQAVLDALTAAAHGETPERGPRGGVIWSPCYFVRRVAWHVLDHVWEIEDRIT